MNGISAVVLHLLALSLLALVPWGEFSTGEGGEGEQILIGHLLRQQLTDTTIDQLRPIDMENPANGLRHESRKADSLMPTALPSIDSTEVRPSISAVASGSPPSMETQSEYEASVLASGSEAFGKMISRLKRDGLDIVIVFDSTRSMQGEIDAVKNQIQRIGDVLLQMVPKTRIGLCTYRDRGDTYLVKGLPLTDNIGQLIVYLEGLSAGGGGDESESVEAGLRWAIQKNRFRRTARKVILIFGDAPPHTSQEFACLSLAAEFRHSQRRDC